MADNEPYYPATTPSKPQVVKLFKRPHGPVTLTAIEELLRLEGIAPRSSSGTRMVFDLPSFDDGRAEFFDEPDEVIYYPRKDEWKEVGSGGGRQKGLRSLMDFIHTARRRCEASKIPKVKKAYKKISEPAEQCVRNLVRYEGIARSCRQLDQRAYWERQARIAEGDLRRMTKGTDFPALVKRMREKWCWFRGEVVLRETLKDEVTPIRRNEPVWMTDLDLDPLLAAARTQQNLNPNQIQPKTKKTMSPHYLQTCIEDDIITVGCVFLDNFNTKLEDLPDDEKRYTFKSRDLDLKPGDLVLGNTVRGPRVVLVAEVHEEPQIEEDDKTDYQWVFQKVNMEKADELRKEDKEFISRIRDEKRKAHRAQVKARFNSGELLGTSGKGGDTEVIDVV